MTKTHTQPKATIERTPEDTLRFERDMARIADDLLRKANHKLIEQNNRLKSALSEAWTIGATHNKPSFDQLNDWRTIINE